MDYKYLAEMLRTNSVSEVKKQMSALTNGYQVFDPLTNPIGVEPGSTTASKVDAMQYTRDMFEGKTVADLGCNLGVFSFIALNHGASKVTGYEVEEKFQSFAETLRDEYEVRFPQYKSRLNFFHGNLKNLPKIQKRDVLLANSIIHWFFVFNPTLTMESVAEWFHRSCNEAVYFEGCVSASETVMQAYKVDINRINEKLFYEEMGKYFDIKFVGRPSYNPNRIVARLYKK